MFGATEIASTYSAPYILSNFIELEKNDCHLKPEFQKSYDVFFYFE